MQASCGATIAGQWEAYAYGVVGLDDKRHGAIGTAATSSRSASTTERCSTPPTPLGSLWTQRGPESQQLGAWPVQHTPSVVLRTSEPGPVRRFLLERRHSEVKDDLSLCTSQSHSARSCNFVHSSHPPADSYQPHHMSPLPESSSPPRAVAL